MVVLLAVGAVAIFTYYQLPTAGVAQAILLCSVNAFGAFAGFRAAVRTPGAARLMWSALATGMTLSTIANIPNYGFPLVMHRAISFPSAVDVLWLLAFPCFMIALLTMAKHRRGPDRIGDLLDTVILVTGGYMVMWVYVLSPTLHTKGLAPTAHIVAFLYPVMDVLLFGILVRLVVGSQANGPMRFLVSSCVVLLVSDSLAAIRLSNGSYHLGGPNDGLWMASYLLMAAAAWHPAAGSFPQARARSDHRLRAGRLVFLGGSVLVAPVLLLAYPSYSTALSISSMVSFLLVIVRISWLNRGLVVASADVEQKTGELRHRELHDRLTGLPNRLLIMDRVEQMLARNRRSGSKDGLLYVDLDGFKNINDTLGHPAGDALLQAVAARMTNVLRGADSIGRICGDEFVVLLDGAPGAAPEHIAERLVTVFREPFDVPRVAMPVWVTASIGIATGDRDAPSELLRDAETALREAKAAGKNCHRTFRAEMGPDIQHRYELEFDLRKALERNQFRLVYQPLYDLNDLTVVGVEALLRWAHPTLGEIQPGEFIPLLESSGQIIEVGGWVMREACTQMATWHAAGSRLGVSVNVSTRQLDLDVVVEQVGDALGSSGLDAAYLTLEITETGLMRDFEASTGRLAELKALGVQLAIDDFGTGYSSLAYLQRLPVDCLKIDRAFTSALGMSRESDSLVRMLVQLGKNLGLKTLAEGVETTSQIDHLRREGVDQVQGFLLSKPIAPDVLEAQLLVPMGVSARRPRPALAAAATV
jgi:diguanylate cyclase (GGDEF)-like protein